jgi:hypothetical protein
MLSMWPPALEIFDKVHQSNRGSDHWHPENLHRLRSPRGALEESNKHSQIVFIDCSLFLIG